MKQASPHRHTKPATTNQVSGVAFNFLPTPTRTYMESRTRIRIGWGKCKASCVVMVTTLWFYYYSFLKFFLGLAGWLIKVRHRRQRQRVFSGPQGAYGNVKGGGSRDKAKPSYSLSAYRHEMQADGKFAIHSQFFMG